MRFKGQLSIAQIIWLQSCKTSMTCQFPKVCVGVHYHDIFVISEIQYITLLLTIL